MLERFYPKVYVENIYEIDYKDLKKRGKTTLLFDLDNTIAPFDIKEPTIEIIDFFNNLKDEGFNICIVSNNKSNRVEIYNKTLKQAIRPKAGKPRKKGIIDAIRLSGGDIGGAVMIGDQLFTDVWVGNRLCIETILVKPIANRDEFTVKLKRGLESIVFQKYKKSIQDKK